MYKYLLLLSCLFACKSKPATQILKPQDKSTVFQKGELLSKYYPLDSIKEIKLQNLKGEHLVKQPREDALVQLLKGYYYDGNYAHTKSGHLLCEITFINNRKLYFYSNTESEIIIDSTQDYTFLSNKRINFENF